MTRRVGRDIKIVLGSILLSVGLYFFMLQNDVAPGGVSGVSLVFSKWFPFLSLGQWSLALNAVLLIAGFVLVGFEFGKNSVISSLVVSLSFMVFERVFPDVNLSDDMMLNAILGSIIVSISLAIVFFNDGSTGGTDILVAILNKYTGLPLSVSLFITDFLIVTMATSLFGIQKGLYSFFVVIAQSVIFEYTIQGLGRKIAIYIISDHNEEIKDMILTKFNRGVTVLKGEGGYSKDDKNVVLTVVPFRKYLDIKSEVLKLDSKAFLFTHSISEVAGEGYTFNVFDN